MSDSAPIHVLGVRWDGNLDCRLKFGRCEAAPPPANQNEEAQGTGCPKQW